jgi:hypothetical protein
MRAQFAILACILVLPFLGQSHAAEQSSPSPNAACPKPDESLLHQGGFRGLSMPVNEKVARYNRQAHAFNDCVRALIDKNYAEIDRIKVQAITDIRRITDTATAQIADITAKMQIARRGVAAGPPTRAEAGGSFPLPECKTADRLLLRPMHKDGRNFRPVDTRSAEYEAQERKGRTCIQNYIAQAFLESKQIEASANAQILRTATDANDRIKSLKAEADAAVAAAKAASVEQASIVADAPVFLNGSKVNWHIEDGVESVTVEVQQLRRSQDTPNGEGDPDTIVCRKPQQLPGLHLLGPETCKRNREWAALNKDGNDLSPDGKSVVPSEKSRTLRKGLLDCIHYTFGGPYDAQISNEICH